MGNISSCSCISNSVTLENFNARLKGKKTAMLLDTDRSTIREIKLPVKSAELMIEAIGHVITPIEVLRRTRRITALRADEELVNGNIYLLVPVSRINSKASEFEIAIAEQLSSKRKGIKTAKVSPSVSRLPEIDGENEVVNFPVCPTSSQRVGNQRQWNPVLDPISESS